MYTGGSESYIRVYDPTADVYDEPELLEFCSEAVTSVHASVRIALLASLETR